MVGRVHKEINVRSSLGIIRGLLIVLVRDVQAQTCLQNDAEYTMSMNFYKIFKYSILTNFWCLLTHVCMHTLPHSLPAWWVQLSIAENWLQHCSFGRICGKKSFCKINAYIYALISYSFSSLLLSTAGHTRASCIMWWNDPAHNDVF